jgi:hypothetical protein
MNVAKLLKDIRASGIKVTADGEFLSLTAANEPSPEILQNLREHKLALLHLLRSETSGWSTDEWSDYFAERAAISEFDHGLPRTNAEKNAFDLCVQEWLRQNPIFSAPWLCNQCQQPTGLIQPYFTVSGIHHPANVWSHQQYTVQWHEARRDLATTALNALGLRKATSVDWDRFFQNELI